ncbi:MAG: hypothetical protein H7Y15_04495 [Pseudonocardia sp.]|nr:hypothetical protein [Pseudonocardia sp.]
MEPVESVTRPRQRALLALGLIALPVVGSAFVLPAVAGASAPQAGIARAVQSDVVEDPAVAAFFAAGYSYDDAVVLAGIWALPDPYRAKIEAGRYLEQGVALADSPRATIGAAEGIPDEVLTDLFLGAGYTLDDATVLAQQWAVTVSGAKVRGGVELKAVGVLPHVDVVPAAGEDSASVDAFFAAGYSYDDAVVLAGIWALPDPYQAKVKAGGYLAQGIALVDSPYADPTADDPFTPDDLAGIFAGSGYTVDDAVVLAQQWGVSVGEAKARAGSELKTVGVLPHVDVVPA